MTRLSLTPLEPRACPAAIGSPAAAFGIGGTLAGYPSYNYRYDGTAPEVSTRQALAPLPNGRLLSLIPEPVYYSSRTTQLLVRWLDGNGQVESAGGRVGIQQLAPTLRFDDTLAVVGAGGQPDGRAVAAALVIRSDGTPDRLLAFRFDPLYRSAGPVTVSLPPDAAGPLDGDGLAVAPDGGVYVAVRVAAGVAVNRLTPELAADPGFGGWRVVAAAGATAGGLAADADGKVLVAADPADFAVTRLNRDGAPDGGFGTGGRAAVDFAGTDTPAALAVQPDGRILVAGAAGGGLRGGTDLGVVRLAADGTPDPAFGAGGRARVAVDLGRSAADAARAVAVAPDGQVVLAGTAEVDPPLADYPGTIPPTAAVVARLTAVGDLDTVFAGGGVYTQIPPPGTGRSDDTYASTDYALGRPDAAAVLPGGRVVTAVTAAALSYSRSSGFYFDYYTGQYVNYKSEYVSARVERKLVGLTGRAEAAPGVAVGGAGAAVALSAAGDSTAATPGIAESVRVARGDFDGDGAVDTAYAAGPGGRPLVRLVSGRTGDDLTAPFAAFEDGFTGGVNVAAGDVDGAGRSVLVVTPDRGGGPRVRVFDLVNGLPAERAGFYGIEDEAFRGGARAALGDLDGDGRADLVVGAGYGGGPRVAVFAGSGLRGDRPPHLAGDFLAFPGADAGRLRDGVFVAVADLTGDGNAEVVVGAGPGGGPRVLALDGLLVAANRADMALARPLADFFAGDPASRGGARVTATDLDGDALADLAVGSGAGQPAAVRLYKAATARAAGPADQTLTVFGRATLADGVFVG